MLFSIIIKKNTSQSMTQFQFCNGFYNFVFLTLNPLCNVQPPRNFFRFANLRNSSRIFGQRPHHLLSTSIHHNYRLALQIFCQIQYCKTKTKAKKYDLLMHLLLTGLCCTSSMTPLSLHNDINKNSISIITFMALFNFFGALEFRRIFFRKNRTLQFLN